MDSLRTSFYGRVLPLSGITPWLGTLFRTRLEADLGRADFLRPARKVNPENVDTMRHLGANRTTRLVALRVVGAVMAAALVVLTRATSGFSAEGAARPVYNEIIGTGQSLSTGLFANPAISTSPMWPTAALMTNLGVRQVIDRGEVHYLRPGLINALVPLAEASTSDHDGETIGAGMAFQINELALEAGQPPWPVVFSAHGVTGAPYAMLKRGTIPYRNSIATVTRVKAILDRMGISDMVRAVTVTHGETDSMFGASAADYEADLVQWRNDYDADLRAITGQREPVMLFTDQMNNYTSAVFRQRAAPTSPIPLAQLRGRPRPSRLDRTGLPQVLADLLPQGRRSPDG